MSGNLSPPFFEPPPLSGGGGDPDPPTSGYYFLASAGTLVASQSGSLLAVPKPATYSTGDLLLCACFASNGTDADLYDPTGDWDLIHSNDVSDDTVQLYGRIATSDGNDDANMSGPFAGIVRVAQMAAFTGTAVWSGSMASIEEVTGKIDNSSESTFSYPGVAAGSTHWHLGIVASVKGTLTDTSDGSTVDAETGLFTIDQHLTDYDGGEDIRMIWAYALLELNTEEIAAGEWDISGGTETARVDGIVVRLKSDDS